MNDIAAYVGVQQLEFLKIELERKKQNHFQYYSLLNKRLMHIVNSRFDCNYWLNCLLINENTNELKERIIKELLSNGVEVRNTWYPLSKQEFLKNFECFGNNESLYFYNHSLCLPSSVNLTEEMILKIVNLINKVI